MIDLCTYGPALLGVPGVLGLSYVIIQWATHEEIAPPPVRIGDASTYRREKRGDGAFGHMLGMWLLAGCVALALHFPVC